MNTDILYLLFTNLCMVPDNFTFRKKKILEHKDWTTKSKVTRRGLSVNIEIS